MTMHLALIMSMTLTLPAQQPVKEVAAVEVKNEPRYVQERVGPNDVAKYVPASAIPLLPVLKNTIDDVWHDIPMRSYLAAQIEKESCITLVHKKCWNSKAELKTHREYGFGFGQTTIAYKADGSERFNVWKELTRLDPVLKETWTWENRYDPAMQMRALLVKNRVNFSAIRFDTYDLNEKMAFLAVYYNSGSPLVDRNLCLRTTGCDPSRWFGHVEMQTAKSKIAVKGYGKSFAEISREYPVNVIKTRRAKYIPYLGS